MLAMTGMTYDPTPAASLDCIKLVIRRSAVYPDERATSAWTLPLHCGCSNSTTPTKPLTKRTQVHAGAGDHPLADLYRRREMRLARRISLSGPALPTCLAFAQAFAFH